MTKQVYALTGRFPAEARYGLTSQMRRAAVSIPSNIAEGYRRYHRAERRQFAFVAFGSASELETQLRLSIDLGFVRSTDGDDVRATLHEVLRLLNAYCRSLQ